jgi:hypothetical protein
MSSKEVLWCYVHRVSPTCSSHPGTSVLYLRHTGHRPTWGERAIIAHRGETITSIVLGSHEFHATPKRCLYPGTSVLYLRHPQRINVSTAGLVQISKCWRQCTRDRRLNMPFEGLRWKEISIIYWYIFLYCYRFMAANIVKKHRIKPPRTPALSSAILN